MADFTTQYPITLSPDGDTNSPAWDKLVQELARIYSKVSDNARLSFGNVAPADPVDSHLWLDSDSKVLKRWSGVEWEAVYTLSSKIAYDNSSSQLRSLDVQAALDELNAIVASVDSTVDGVINGTVLVAHSALADHATTASRFSASSTISLSGDAIGSVSFDGSEDVNMVVDVISADHATTASRFSASSTISLSGDAIGSVSFDGSEDVNMVVDVISADHATTASRFSASSTISLSGDATGFVSFDGSEDVDISVNVKDDSHIHDTRYYTKAQCDAKYTNYSALAGGVGSHALATAVEAGIVLDFGTIISGSLLSPAGCSGARKFTLPVLSGAWRCLGYVDALGAGYTTLFVRIA